MTVLEAIQERHSVRSYLDKPIPDEVLGDLQSEIEACNQAGGLHIQLLVGEDKAFDSRMAHYGKFSGVRNYLALVGKKSGKLDGLCGLIVFYLGQMPESLVFQWFRAFFKSHRHPLKYLRVTNSRQKKEYKR